MRDQRQTTSPVESMHKESEVIANEFYQSDFNYSIQVNRWLFKLVGAWPRKFADIRIFQKLQNTLVCLCYICFVFLIIPSILYIILEEDNLQMQIRYFFPTLAWIMTFIKYYYLLIHGSDIFYCLKQMEHDWRRVNNSTDRDVMLNHANIGRYVAILSVFWLYLTSSCFMLSVAGRISVDQGNETIFIRRLPFAFYDKIVNPTVTPNYEILFASQAVSDFVVATIVSNTNTLVVIFVLHVIGQIQVLKHVLITLIVEDEIEMGEEYDRMKWNLDMKPVNTKLAVLVKQQEWEEKSFDKLVTDLITVMAVTFNIFILCFTGEILIEKCEEIGETAYMIEWYRLPPKGSRNILLIILMSNYGGIRITAGKFVKLSLSSFSYILQSAAVYLNLLLTLTTY
ncbi:odorant receptor 82a-like [Prorops nasuta]|uniref:odorant receptor 82a-like n=1 Tax=Prorops nasuta TaxID=863751 RepID=UPI0034CD52F6